MSYQPVVIIGAPRSGTNMLRDVLTALPGFATWPCDEINFVWKHGNLRFPGDDLSIDQIRPCTRRFVTRQFESVARRSGAGYVVEKTCANSLRVSFVDALVPGARYILLLRDGPDAVASTLKRWRNPSAEMSYYRQKLRFVAGTDLPWVLGTALWRRLKGRFQPGDRSWDTWGPVFPDLLTARRSGATTAQLSALQWSRCVEESLRQLAGLDRDRWLPVRYEDFVTAPGEQLARIMTFLGAQANEATIAAAVAGVSTGSIGKSSSVLDEPTLADIAPYLDRAAAAVREVLD